MPVLRIHALRPEGLDIAALLHRCSEEVAVAFDYPPEHCWSLFVELHDGEYLEGGSFRSVHTGTHSPVAILSAYQGRSEDQIAGALRGVAAAITTAYGYDPGDVFVEYRELKAGQIFTGGEVR